LNKNRNEKKIGGDRMKKMLVVLVGLLCLLCFVSLVLAAGLTVSVSDTTSAPEDIVKVPIILEGAADVGSMDIVLKYDAEVLRAVAVEGAELGKNAFIEANTASEGEVIIALQIATTSIGVTCSSARAAA
jgi:hypothetical protein